MGQLTRWMGEWVMGVVISFARSRRFLALRPVLAAVVLVRGVAD